MDQDGVPDDRSEAEAFENACRVTHDGNNAGDIGANDDKGCVGDATSDGNAGGVGANGDDWRGADSFSGVYVGQSAVGDDWSGANFFCDVIVDQNVGQVRVNRGCCNYKDATELNRHLNDDKGNSEIATMNMIMDTGSTIHIVNDKKYFHDYEINQSFKVKIGNGKYVYSSGIGTVIIKCGFDNGKKSSIMLKRVIHIPNMKNNILSVSKIVEDNNYSVVFHDNVFEILENDSIIANGFKHEKLFVLECEIDMNDKRTSRNHVYQVT